MSNSAALAVKKRNIGTRGVRLAVGDAPKDKERAPGGRKDRRPGKPTCSAARYGGNWVPEADFTKPISDAVTLPPFAVTSVRKLAVVTAGRIASKDEDVCPNEQHQSERGYDRERGRLPQHAQRITDIQHQVFHQWHAGVAAGFLRSHRVL